MTRTMAEAVGFIAFGLNVWGNWALTSKRSSGWWIRIGSNAAQLVYALAIRSPYLIVNAIVFGGINVVGAWRWKREAT